MKRSLFASQFRFVPVVLGSGVVTKGQASGAFPLPLQGSHPTGKLE